MRERLIDWIAISGAIAGLVAVLYFLSFPPFLLHAQKVGAPFPAIYNFAFSLLESDFHGPYVWYFKNVWNTELVFIGTETGTPRYVQLTYALLGAALICVIRVAVLRKMRKKVRVANSEGQGRSSSQEY